MFGSSSNLVAIGGGLALGVVLLILGVQCVMLHQRPTTGSQASRKRRGKSAYSRVSAVDDSDDDDDDDDDDRGPNRLGGGAERSPAATAEQGRGTSNVGSTTHVEACKAAPPVESSVPLEGGGSDECTSAATAAATAAAAVAMFDAAATRHAMSQTYHCD